MYSHQGKWGRSNRTSGEKVEGKRGTVREYVDKSGRKEEEKGKVMSVIMTAFLSLCAV